MTYKIISLKEVFGNKRIPRYTSEESEDAPISAEYFRSFILYPKLIHLEEGEKLIINFDLDEYLSKAILDEIFGKFLEVENINGGLLEKVLVFSYENPEMRFIVDKAVKCLCLNVEIRALSRKSKNFKIPVSSLKKLTRDYYQRQAILVTWGEDKRTHVVTYGISKRDCEEAAIGGNYIKRALKWPEKDIKGIPNGLKSIFSVWNSVEEKGPPKDNKQYLIYAPNNFEDEKFLVARYSENYNLWFIPSSFLLSNQEGSDQGLRNEEVSHYMPLPNNPE